MVAALFALLFSGLVFEAPTGWKPISASSSMRLAQWELPGEAADASAEVVVFYFGEGSGGSVEDNLDRWFGQFEQADGSATRDHATVERLEVGSLRVTLADMSGTYVAPVRPGASQRSNLADYRMVATVVEGDSGPWFIRLLGPAATVATWRASFDEFLKSLDTEG